MLAAWLSVLPATAQELEPIAAAVGAGPQLCFCIGDDSSGQRVERLQLAALDGSGAACEIMRARGNTAVLARLDRTRLLLASYARPYGLCVLDVAAGQLRELAPGAPHGFVAVHGDEVLYLGDGRRGDARLYAAPWRQAGTARALCAQPFDRVAQLAGNLVVAVAGSDVWLCSVVRGTGRKLFAADGGFDLRARLSPSGSLLAVGWRRDAATGALAVVDAATGALRRQWQPLPIDLPPESSGTPTVEVGWADDDVVVCSETRGTARRFAVQFVFVRRSVASGERLGEVPDPEVSVCHRPPPLPAPAQAPPAFAIERDGSVVRLLANGRNQPLLSLPVATLQYEDLCLSPDGRFAVARTDGALQLFTAGSAAPRLLTRGFAHGFVWLPAAP